MKRTVILGSTGSIGINTLKVISNLKDKFKVVGLTANSNVKLLSEQARIFHPEIVAIKDKARFKELKTKIKGNIKLVSGPQGLRELASYKNCDLVVIAIAGSDALIPLMAAIEATKQIALANKESLVMAGKILTELAKKKKVKILPVDSEHSAIWQCLNGRPTNSIKRIYLTCSGGPLINTKKEKFALLKPSQVINHPRWKMGKKISVDSATLMNKGLEVIEAHWLFGVPVRNIKILIHPQAIIHSMVEFVDGAILAQMGITDMRVPIQYALTYPERFPSTLPAIDFKKIGKLTFQQPELDKFPCLKIALWAAAKGASYPCVLSASNEELVKTFLAGRIRLTDFAPVLRKVLSAHKKINNPSLSDILELDNWGREYTKKVVLCLH